jgi:lysophospholipase L1-like esterase
VANGLVRKAAFFGFALIGAEVAYAILRPAPRLPEFDPSGEFGDPSNPTVRIAVLGDSSVTAPGVRHPDEIWIRIAVRRLAEQRHVVLASQAVGGSKAVDVRNGQLHAALEFQPDIAVISVGANDAIRGVPLRRFENDLDHTVAALRDSGAAVILSGVGDLGTIPRLHEPLRSLMTARSLAYHRVHQKVAERHGAIVAEHRNDDRTLWLRDRSLWSEDLFHVSALGHARWAEYAIRALQPVLADG